MPPFAIGFFPRQKHKKDMMNLEELSISDSSFKVNAKGEKEPSCCQRGGRNDKDWLISVNGKCVLHTLKRKFSLKRKVNFSLQNR